MLVTCASCKDTAATSGELGEGALCPHLHLPSCRAQLGGEARGDRLCSNATDLYCFYQVLTSFLFFF